MRQFLVTLLLIWAAASIAAFVYSQEQHISRTILFALLPAFLLEIGFYLMPGFETARKLFDALGPKAFRAALLVASAIAPYLLESWRLASFRFESLLILIALVAIAAFWYALLKPSPLVDLLFLILMAGVFLSKVFVEIYPRPTPHLDLEILGRLMWIRLGVMAVLSLRRLENIRFGFLPKLNEWRIGLEQFLYFLPVGGLAAFLLHFARFQPITPVWWKMMLFVPAIFFGMLWVVALAEEFFFRGLLQQLLSRGLHSEVAGLLLTSVVFGAVHLPFRKFPNWRFAVIAGITGIFYGIAFVRSGSVRASMVTHALVVTTWRSLFTA
jgi:membrane protease YdiL (CAAX protease family)